MYLVIGKLDRISPFLRIVFVLIFAAVIGASSQSYRADSLAVRAILDSNGLSTIGVTDVSLAENGRITQLYIFLENVSVLPSNVATLTQLKTLYLMSNSLTELPAELSYLTNLEELVLNDNYLLSMPFEIGALTALKTLELDNNSIDTAVQELGYCRNLTTFSMDNNGLKSLPSTMGNLTQLTTLSLANNEITTLPATIGACTLIRTLSVEYNKLKSLPQSVTELKPTMYCNFGYNELAALAKPLADWITIYDPDWLATQTGVSGIADDFSDALVNPLRDKIAVRDAVLHLTLAGASFVTFEMYTVKGLRILTHSLGMRSTGSYTMPLKQLTESAKPVAAGCYFVRVSFSEQVSIVPVTIVRQ